MSASTTLSTEWGDDRSLRKPNKRYYNYKISIAEYHCVFLESSSASPFNKEIQKNLYMLYILNNKVVLYSVSCIFCLELCIMCSDLALTRCAPLSYYRTSTAGGCHEMNPATKTLRIVFVFSMLRIFFLWTSCEHHTPCKWNNINNNVNSVEHTPAYLSAWIDEALMTSANNRYCSETRIMEVMQATSLICDCTESTDSQVIITCLVCWTIEIIMWSAYIHSFVLTVCFLPAHLSVVRITEMWVTLYSLLLHY